MIVDIILTVSKYLHPNKKILSDYLSYFVALIAHLFKMHEVGNEKGLLAKNKYAAAPIQACLAQRHN